MRPIINHEVRLRVIDILGLGVVLGVGVLFLLLSQAAPAPPIVNVVAPEQRECPAAEPTTVCVSAVSERCSYYAKIAVEQYELSRAHDCGGGGPRWQDDYEAHYGWCLIVSKAEARGEHKLREERLLHCPGALD